MRTKTIKFNGRAYVKVATANGIKLSRFALAICLIIFCTSCSERESGRKIPSMSTQVVAKAESNDFIRFSSKNVTETLYQGATGYYYIVYNDIDDGMDNELLQVDTETLRRIEAAMSTKEGKLKGYLIEKDGQYIYCHDRPQE